MSEKGSGSGAFKLRVSCSGGSVVGVFEIGEEDDRDDDEDDATLGWEGYGHLVEFSLLELTILLSQCSLFVGLKARVF